MKYWASARSLVKFTHEKWYGQKFVPNSNAAKERWCSDCDHITFGTLFSKGETRRDPMHCELAKFAYLLGEIHSEGGYLNFVHQHYYGELQNLSMFHLGNR